MPDMVDFHKLGTVSKSLGFLSFIRILADSSAFSVLLQLMYLNLLHLTIEKICQPSNHLFLHCTSFENLDTLNVLFISLIVIAELYAR